MGTILCIITDFIRNELRPTKTRMTKYGQLKIILWGLKNTTFWWDHM